jgi:hypothetical protein
MDTSIALKHRKAISSRLSMGTHHCSPLVLDFRRVSWNSGPAHPVITVRTLLADDLAQW